MSSFSKTMVGILGPNWAPKVAGIVGGLFIAVEPTVQSAMSNAAEGVKVDWHAVGTGLIVAILSYVVKSHNVSNSPTPLAVPQTVVPVLATASPFTDVKPVALAEPVPIIPVSYHDKIWPPSSLNKYSETGSLPPSSPQSKAPIIPPK